MKKFLVIIFSILSIVIISINQTQAVSVADFTPILDKKISKLETTEEKVKYLQSFSELLTESKYTKSKDAWLYNGIREYCLNMLNIFQHELNEELGKSFQWIVSNNSEFLVKTSILELPHLSDNLPNIDIQKVRESILSWHNQERASLWRSAYKYSLDLEWSATTRANNLAVFGKIKNLHARNASDWYYNYNSMTNWFSNLWITFWNAPKWATSFSETVWRNVYKCDKSDCTQEIITAIKKTWNWLIMWEKASNGSHYKAAVMKHFTQMWVWIAIDKANNRYYLVIHYWVNF